MFWTLLAAIFAGLAGVGIGMALRKLSGNRLPKGILPVSAGIAMIATTVAQEYAWFPNNLDDLPPDAVVLSTREQQAIYQPWTYIRPWIRGFIAFAPGETVETVENSDVFVIQAHIRERWQPEMIRPVVVDCVRYMRFDVDPGTTFDDLGRPEGASPTGRGDEDPVIASVCQAERSGS